MATSRIIFQQVKGWARLQPYILQGVSSTGRQLGRGSFGTVIELRFDGGALCAGKQLHDVLVDPLNQDVQKIMEKFVSECELMSKMRHPNIVTFYGLAFIGNRSVPVLVMELMDRSLENLLEQVQPKDIYFAIRVSILFDVTKGLAFLHAYKPPIIHRDLTARNILLTTTREARIADLGNSRILGAEKLTKALSTVPGTLTYMPPEALGHKPTYDVSLDIFSFGHTSLYVLSHISPSHLLQATYPDTTGKLQARSEVERRANSFEKIEANELIPFKLVEMVKACLDNTPQNRPTATQVSGVLEQYLQKSEEYQMFVKRVKRLSMAEECEPQSPPPTTERRPRAGSKHDHLMTRIKGGSPYQIEMKAPHGGFGRKKQLVWKECMLELIDGDHEAFLLYYTKLNDKKVLKLENVVSVAPVIARNTEKFQFNVSTNNVEIQFRTKTEEERDCWVQALCDAASLNPEPPSDSPEQTDAYEYFQLQAHPGFPKSTLQHAQEEADGAYEVVTLHTEYEHLGSMNPPAVYSVPTKAKLKRKPSKTQLVKPERTPHYHEPRAQHGVTETDDDDNMYQDMSGPLQVDIPPSPSTQKDRLWSSELSEFPQEQLAALANLLQGTIHYGAVRPTSPHPTSPRPTSPCPKSPHNMARPQQPLYDDVVLQPPGKEEEQRYVNIPSPSRVRHALAQAPETIEQIYDEVGDSQVTPEVRPKPSVSKRKRKDKPTNVLLPQNPAVPLTETEQKIQTLLQERRSANRAISMLYMEDDQEDVAHGRRPTWAKANTTSALPPQHEREEESVKALYIPMSFLSDLTFIAAGAFGAVQKGKLQNLTGELVDVAVKRLNKCDDETDMRNFEREMAISADPQMKHPNIVQVYGLVREANWIVMEYLPLGDLKTFLKNQRRPLTRLVKYMLDIAMGMQFIADKGLIHRDLAARNILLDSPNETCKVSDFGLLRRVPGDENVYLQQSDTKCPIRWTAPESLSKRSFSSASDVWSYGITVWEIFNPHTIPFKQYNNVQVAIIVVDPRTNITHELPIPMTCPENITRLIKSCWQKNPTRRPSFLLLVKALTEIKFGALH